MQLKKDFKVGETVECQVPYNFPIQGKILEVDSHPLEYDMLRIKVDSIAVQDIETWVSERDCIRITEREAI